MPKPWSVVEQSESYKKLSPQAQTQAKAEYWDAVVSQRPEYATLDQKSQGQAKVEFFGGRLASDIPESEFHPRNIGADFLTRSLFQPASKSITGKSISDVVDTTSGGARPFGKAFDLYGDNPLAKAQAFTESYLTGLAGDIADVATTPINYIMPFGLKTLSKIPIGPKFAPEVAQQFGRSRMTAGEVVSSAKPVREFGKFLTKERKPPIIGVSERNLDDYITESIRKGIRPSMAGKKFGGQIEQYNRKSVEAVKDIVANKDKLGLVDDLGNPEARTPKSLKESVDAIDNLKQNIWSEIEQAAEKTGQAGVKIKGQDVAKAIVREFNQSKYKLNPELKDAAIKEARIFANSGEITPSDMNFHIKAINQRLTNYFKRGLYETGKSQDVDAFLARKLNGMLDDVITKETGTQFKFLKQRYSNLKTIEEDLVKRYGVDARKNIKGFFDLGDVWSDGQIVRGMFSLNPAEVASGVAQKAVVKAFKRLNDPNRIINDMFKNVDKIYKPTSKFNADVLVDIPRPQGPFVGGPRPMQNVPYQTRALPSPKDVPFRPTGFRTSPERPLRTPPPSESGPTLTTPISPEVRRFMERNAQIKSEEDLQRKIMMLEVIKKGGELKRPFGKFLH